MYNSNALRNHQDAESLLTAMNNQAAVLAGCSEEGVKVMFEILTLACVKLELLIAIEEEIERAYNSL